MIIGTLENGKKCVYDLPNNIKTAEEMKSLIYDYHYSEKTREELYGQPKLLSLNGPMYNGLGHLQYTGEEVVIIRYELPTRY